MTPTGLRHRRVSSAARRRRRLLRADCEPARRHGERVSVWARASACRTPTMATSRCTGCRAVRDPLTRDARQGRRAPRAPRVWLVQYVPRLRLSRDEPRVLRLARAPASRVDGVPRVTSRSVAPARATPGPGAVTRIMAAVVARASERVFVTTPAWADPAYDRARCPPRNGCPFRARSRASAIDRSARDLRRYGGAADE